MPIGAGERVLVVDDEPDITALVAYHLAKAGFRVSTAATGVDALAAINEQRPSLIVLDRMLPGMTGVAAGQHRLSRVDRQRAGAGSVSDLVFHVDPRLRQSDGRDEGEEGRRLLAVGVPRRRILGRVTGLRATSRRHDRAAR